MDYNFSLDLHAFAKELANLGSCWSKPQSSAVITRSQPQRHMTAPRLLLLTFLSLLTLSHTVASAEEKVRAGRLITLEEAYDLALASDQSIAIAMIGIQQARLQPASAWVKLTPTVGADASLSIRDSLNVANRRYTSSGGVTIDQPIFDPTFLPALRRGKLAVEAAGMDYHRQIRETLFGVAQAYYDVYTQQKIIEVDKESLRLAREQQEAVQVRFEVGEVTRAEVLRAQVTVENARRILIEDTSALVSLKNILANILNLEQGEAFRVSEPAARSSPVPKFENLLKQALTQREDIRSQNLLVRQNEERITEVRSSYLPSVVAQIDASTNDNTTGNPRYQNDVQGNIGLRIPLYSGGQKAIDVKGAKLDTAQSKLQMQQLIKQVEQEVKDAWLDARRLRETLEILKAQVEAAEVGYRELQDQFRAGQASNLDVLAALNELINARRDLTVETYREQLALRNVERAAGSFQTDRVQKAKVP